eukprot:86606-Alexandrium_andersonii.AAC.1
MSRSSCVSVAASLPRCIHDTGSGSGKTTRRAQGGRQCQPGRIEANSQEGSRRQGGIKGGAAKTERLSTVQEQHGPVPARRRGGDGSRCEMRAARERQ